MSGGPSSPESPTEQTAAEKLAALDRQRAETAQARADLEVKYVAPPAGTIPVHEIKVDLDRWIGVGLAEPGDPEVVGHDPNFPMGQVEVAPENEQTMTNMRAALERTVDAGHDARDNELWGAPVGGRTPRRSFTRAQSGNPTVLGRIPDVEQATQQRLDFVTEGAYMIDTSAGPDGLFNLNGRLIGASQEARDEIARDRETFRQAEYNRRYQEVWNEVRGLAGGARVGRLVELFQEGMGRGEYEISQYEQEVTIATTGRGGVAGTRQSMEKRAGATPADHEQNRELAPMYAEAFNQVVTTSLTGAGEQEQFARSMAKINDRRLQELREQGTQVQEQGVQNARNAAAARDTISRMGPTADEETALRYQAGEEAVDAARADYFTNNPDVIRPGEQGTRLDFDLAYEQAMDNNSVWAAGVRAVNNMPDEFWDRYDEVRTQRDGTQDRGLRDTLDESMNQMMAEAQERQAKAEQEQQRRNEIIKKDPARLREVASGAFQENRRQWLMTQATPPNDIYASYDLNEDRFNGPQWGPGGIATDFEQQAIKPYLKQAMAARATGRPEDEARYLGQAADAWEKAHGDVQEAVVDSHQSSIEIAQLLAEAVAAKEPGTVVKGRTTNEALNQIMIDDLQRQLGLVTDGVDADGNPVRHVRPPDGALVHRDDPPTNKEGKPLRGRRGKILAKDLIYRVPGFDNAVMVTRWNPDGQLISCEVQVTEDTAMRQRHGLSRATSGGYTDEATPELATRLKAQFEEQKGAAANPERADRRAGSAISIGRNAERMGNDSGGDGYGYTIPEQGGLWARETIQDRLARYGMDPASADQVSHRRMPARQNAKARRWWWETAVNRDRQADNVIQRRAA